MQSAQVRAWQSSLLLGRNHPSEWEDEDRHRRCNARCLFLRGKLQQPCHSPSSEAVRVHFLFQVCRAEFALPPPDRAALLEHVAAVRAEDLQPGVLLRYAAECPRGAEPKHTCSLGDYSACTPAFLRCLKPRSAFGLRSCA